MGGHFDLPSLQKQIASLEEKLNDPDIWQNQELANEYNSSLTILKKQTNEYVDLEKLITSSIETLTLLNDVFDQELYMEIKTISDKVSESLKDLEIKTLLSKEYDKLNCYLEIHPGAGGTESHDWASMLLRMYTMYFTKNNIDYELIDIQPGETAGIKSALIYVKDLYAYGYLKGEIGVHRLVRISPFDSNHRRHTSFAAVNVTPEFKNNMDIIIKDEDIRIDVFRSSGNGGQGVNTTDSAVRITHFPSGIVVSVQNERSQIRNKEIALDILKSKLYKLKLDAENEKINSIKGNSKIDFGSQIRNYVLEPYSLVKDLRSDYTSSNPKAILDGDIKELLESVLRRG